MIKTTLFGMLLFLAASISAQNSLSLDQAIAYTLENNYQIRIVEKQAEIAGINNSWGQTSALPRIDLNGAFNYNLTDNSENPTSFIREEIQSTGLNYGATINWTLFDGFGMFISKDRLEALQFLSEQNAEVVIENSIQAVILAYYNVQLQKEKYKLIQEVIQLSTDRLEYEQTRKELGSGSTFDMLQFENAVLADQTNAALQELAFNNAQRNLNLIMAVSPEEIWDYSTDLSAPTMTMNLESLLNQSMNENTQLKSQMFNQILAEKETQLARSGMYPVVGFNAGYNNSASTFEAGDLSGDGKTLSYFGSFTINFNLFNGGKTRRAVQNAQINQEIASITLEELKQNVNIELANSYGQFEAQQKIFVLADQSVHNAQISLDIAKERLNSGSINTFNYRDTQLAYLQSALTLLESEYNLLITHTNLTRLTGGLLKTNS
ncbi:MAG: TolC family protein [Flavobacteriales bacterium]